MSLLISGLLIILGFIFLIKGSDWMVDGASNLAKKYKVSDLAIGLTIVAFGTSAPELVVNSVASIDNLPNIIFGNVIGSNIFNLFMILGIVGLISPIVVQTTTVWKEIPISFVAILILYFLVNGLGVGEDQLLSRVDGMILFALFILFLVYVYMQLKSDDADIGTETLILSNSKIWGMIILGFAGLILGGKMVVDNAITVATDLGVSQKIIGLTIIAAGTSLPELVTSVVAAMKKNSDIAIGNIIGSNIFNILLILSVSSFIRPLSFDVAFNTDVYLLGAGTIFLFIAMFTGGKKKLDRWEAAILLLVFIIYTGYLVGKEM
jgi:cation:H+ antiporter